MALLARQARLVAPLDLAEAEPRSAERHRVLSDLLLAADAWTPAAPEPYAEERFDRMRRVTFAARVSAEIRVSFGPASVERRRRALARMAEAPDLAAWSAIIFGGPESVPAEAFDEQVRRRLLAPAS